MGNINRMTDSRVHFWMRLSVALVSVFFPLFAQAGGYNAKGWDIPREVNASHIRTWRNDVDARIPGRETVVKLYRKSNGEMYYLLSANGWVYAVVMGENRDYDLVDVNGNGLFEQAIDGSQPQMNEVPRWVYERESSLVFEQQCAQLPDASCEYSRTRTYNLGLACNPNAPNSKCRDPNRGNSTGQPREGVKILNPEDVIIDYGQKSGPISEACVCVDSGGRRFSPLFGVPDCDVEYSLRDYAACN